MNTLRLTLKEVEPVLADFGRRHATICKLEIFGSVANGKASEQSDLDVLVTFGNEAPKDIHYIDLFTNLVEELQLLFGRKVDLVDRSALRNDAFGHNATRNLRTVYERL